MRYAKRLSPAVANFLDMPPAAMLLVALPFAFRSAAATTQFPARKAAPFVTEQTTRIVLPSHIERVSAAAAAVMDFFKDCGLDENLSFGVDMAVREAITNAVVHGNLEDDVKSVELVFSCSDNQLEIEVSDHGSGFDPATVPDPTDPANLLKTSGRGIFLMRSFMDVVEWRARPQGGTTVRMVKRF